MKNFLRLLILFTVIAYTQYSVSAQLTLPPSGDNQKSSVTQYIGLASVTIKYSSPDVHGLRGEDRTGHIWGELVPYGLNNLQFGYSTESNPSPWRGGANENTTINFTHDVLVEGKKIVAGTYGLHFIPGETEWIVIFSNNSTSWGSYFYNKNEDYMRVSVKPVKNEFHEWLTYEFTDRQPESTVVTLMWENLAVPINIKVENMKMLYVENIRNQLRGSAGFEHTSWVQAANYCADNNINLEEGLIWANKAIDDPFFGRRNFVSLSTKAAVLNKLGRTSAADSIMKVAVNDPTASMMDIHYYARGLQAEKKNKQALEIFQINYKQYPEKYVTNLGLARGYSANGDYKNALKYAKSALSLNPDPQVKQTLEDAIKKLERNEDFN